MIQTTTRNTALALALLAGLLPAVTLRAEPQPSSELLLPYFEVDLTGFGLTTLFHVTNAADHPVPVTMTVHSNWGIPLVGAQVFLEPRQTRAFNLRDWLLFGRLPGETLDAGALGHLQAALLGLPSPADGLYYGSETRPEVAVGYVTARVAGETGERSLWGNYFLIDPQNDSAQGDVLVDLDPDSPTHGLCRSHLLFFLEGGAFDGGTELLVWTGRQGMPSASPEGYDNRVGLHVVAHDGGGVQVAEGRQEVLTSSARPLAELSFPETAGTLEVLAIEDAEGAPMASFVALRYRAEGRYSVGLQAFCQPMTATLSGAAGGGAGSAGDD